MRKRYCDIKEKKIGVEGRIFLIFSWSSAKIKKIRKLITIQSLAAAAILFELLKKGR